MITFSKLGSYGRLGNQMFQIASTIGVAVKNGVEFGFPDFDNQVYFKNRLPSCRSKLPRVDVGWGYHEIFAQKADLVGYLQSEKYFENCKGIVRYYLTPDYDIEEREGVAVHVRRGDYDDLYHPRLGEEYYSVAIGAMEALGYDRFTFFSDTPEDIGWAEDYGEIRPVGSEIEDLVDFSGHEAYIIGNSTWSWWGAWLGDPYECKHVCAPYRWFGPKANLHTLDLIPDRWMRLLSI